MLRHAPPDDFRPPAKNILLILITTKKVSRNTLSSLDLMRVNNSGHVSDDVIVKEKVTSEKGQWLFIIAVKQASCRIQSIDA